MIRAGDKLSKSKPIDFDVNASMVNDNALQFFELVHIGDLVQQMVEVYYNEDIVINICLISRNVG